MNTNVRETLKNRVQELKTIRDQIGLDIHLATLELRDEWRALEQRLPDPSVVADDVKEATAQVVDSLLREARLLRNRVWARVGRGGQTVADVMSGEVASCAPDTSLGEAARRMWQRDVGCLVVIDQGRVVGVLTDRDACMSGYFEGRRLDEIPAAKAMSKELHVCTPDSPLRLVARMMKEQRIRRMPVLDREGQLVGIVTLGDLARAATSGRDDDSVAIRSEDVATTLAAITAPAT
jgi:CBS domain-containing protein